MVQQMWSLLFVALFFLVTCYSDDRIELRICSKGDSSACQQTARVGIACSKQNHGVDCLQGLRYNQVNFGRINSETAWLGANLVGDDVVVVGTVASEEPLFQSVVLVKKEKIIDKNKNDLKGIKFCHPGLKHDDSISKLLLEEFENSLIEDTDLCAKNSLTLVENRFKSLAKFLGESCRPGPWTYNEELDKTLKSQYSSLCKLCNSSSCDVNYNEPFADSIKCLQNGGEAALTSLHEAKKLDINRSYQYLCPNFTFTDNPCPWSNALPDLIVSHRESYSSAKSTISKYLPTQSVTPFSITDETITDSLKAILELQKTDKINISTSESGQTLKDYVQATRPVPTVASKKKCDVTAKWCTHSEAEQEKCKWLSQAALSEGIFPAIECVMTTENDKTCLEKVHNNEADIVVASADQAYITLKKGLTSIAYPETDSRYLNSILLVKRSDENNIQSFGDLKGKRACFPQYGGKEYLSFIENAKSQKIIDKKSCKYDQLLNDLISSGCLPGVRSSLLNEIAEKEYQDKFCEICKPSSSDSSTQSVCNDDDSNLYYGSLGSLKCLDDKVADFAVITKPLRGNRLLNNTNYKVICRNGTQAAYEGLNVDDNCALNIITTSEVVVNADNSEKSNLLTMLQDYEQYFGRSLQKSFHIFDSFNHTKDLLFVDSTPGLTFSTDNSPPKWVENYKTLIKHADECSGAYTLTVSLLIAVNVVVFKIFL